MLFPIKLPSSEWMSILLSVSITLSSLVLSSPIPAGSTGSPDRNVDTRGAPWAEASPTAEQCIRVLRARRFELAQPETPESPITVKTFALMMSQLAYHHIMEYGTGGVVEIDDPNLESMMPCVIPDEVGLTLGDLKTPPTGEMSLETLYKRKRWDADKAKRGELDRVLEGIVNMVGESMGHKLSGGKQVIVAIGMDDFTSAKSRHVMFTRGYLEHDERPNYLKPPSKDKNAPMKRKADEGGTSRGGPSKSRKTC
ncbi:hypothetical protein SeMB42_g00434 [Synchytrium endobioticum]|uniref:Uncharacterized protein n=1 Tax=Synchytrium endobioticum TaxID=286115 RepID=A0A507DRP0_9FUNG|nr:hypothetical protein SeMB42_g00434 [Synchytrium endobioticum]